MRVPAVLAVVASCLPAQSWSWVRIGNASLGRLYHAVSPSQSGSVLLFGGVPYSPGGFLGDTLEWNNTTGSWLQSAGGPPARAYHAMAFDSFRNRVVMFGGESGSIQFPTTLADTWEWQGGWQARVPLTSPPPRSRHAMAFDSVRHRVVMFGGVMYVTTGNLGDTWEWDGTNWTQFTPAQNPSPRSLHGMAFDPVRGHVLLFGGDLGNYAYDGSTWEWDGTTWTQLMPAVSPGPRAYHQMATDTQRGRVLVFGGIDNSTVFFETWEWNGSVWTSLTGNASSGPGLGGAMAFCAQASRMLYAQIAGNWEWNPPPPNVRSYGTGCGGLALAATPNSQPLLGQTFTSQVTGCPPATVIAFMALGFSDQVLGPFPLPMDLSGYGMPGCWLCHDAVTICLPCQLAGSVATHSIALPNDPSLTGTAAFLQGWTSTPGANPGGVLTSSALALTLGY